MKTPFKILSIASILALGALFTTGAVFAQDNGQSSFSPFAIFGTTITPKSNTWRLKIPQLGGSGTKCIHVDNTGLFSTAAADCGSGGGSSASSTLLQDNNTFSGLNTFTNDNNFTGVNNFGVVNINPSLSVDTNKGIFTVSTDGLIPYIYSDADLGISPSGGVGAINILGKIYNFFDNGGSGASSVARPIETTSFETSGTTAVGIYTSSTIPQQTVSIFMGDNFVQNNNGNNSQFEIQNIGPDPGSFGLDTLSFNAVERDPLTGNIVNTVNAMSMVYWPLSGAMQSITFNGPVTFTSDVTLSDFNFNSGVMSLVDAATLIITNGTSGFSDANPIYIGKPAIAGKNSDIYLSGGDYNAPYVSDSGNIYIGIKNTGNSGNTLLGGVLDIGETGSLGWTGAASASIASTTGNFSTRGIVDKYKGVATVSNGIPSELATVDLTGQTAAIGATTVYAVPAAGAGMYRVSFVAKVTTAGSVSSVLGGATGFQVKYTDQDDSVVVTSGAVTNVSGLSLSLNTTQATYSGSFIANCKASTNLQYILGYTSAGTAMAYNLHIKVEAL